MTEHYFSEKPTAKLKLKIITEFLREKEHSFYTAAGVFSKSKVDFGTKLLANKMLIGEHDTVLDLGCGIGVIGRLAAEITDNQVTLVDINQRACKMARMNTKGLKNTKVLSGDKYEPVKTKKFDAILLNPPQTAGKKTCFEMIEDAKKHLNKGGTLQIVARHNKGGKTLSEKMEETFGNLETVSKRGGYRIYLSRLE